MESGSVFSGFNQNTIPEDIPGRKLREVLYMYSCTWLSNSFSLYTVNHKFSGLLITISFCNRKGMLLSNLISFASELYRMDFVEIKGP